MGIKEIDARVLYLEVVGHQTIRHTDVGGGVVAIRLLNNILMNLIKKIKYSENCLTATYLNHIILFVRIAINLRWVPLSQFA